jgi:hypothetical protein
MLVDFPPVGSHRFKFQVFTINLMPYSIDFILQFPGVCRYDFKVLFEGAAKIKNFGYEHRGFPAVLLG